MAVLFAREGADVAIVYLAPHLRRALPDACELRRVYDEMRRFEARWFPLSGP